MEKVDSTTYPHPFSHHLPNNQREPRLRLTTAAAAYFPDFPLVGAKQCFYISEKGYVMTANERYLDMLEERGYPFMLVEVIDDAEYVALKLDFFNC